MSITLEQPLTEHLRHYQQRVDHCLSHWLDNLPDTAPKLKQAMRHASLLGGKRIRPFLVYQSGRLFGVPDEILDGPAVAIECIHAYSLVHDDLPAMDDDALRRGQPTCHIAFDEATAVLAGDSLQTLAFEILTSCALPQELEPVRPRLVRELARASGYSGMCGGQALDLAAEGQRVDLAQLEQIHQHKTGALLRCAVRLGALCSGSKVSPEELEQLDNYARDLGLAFQIQDDILDVTSDTETLGKPQGSDLAHDKATYPALLGLDGARDLANQHYQSALQALNAIPYNTQLLNAVARFIIERKS